MKNHYATLEISPDATTAEIKAARRKMLLQWHPDMNGGCNAAAKEKTIEILLAAEILLDPVTKTEYDRMHHAHFRSAKTASPPPPQEPHTQNKPQTIIICKSCGKKNVNPAFGHCMYCGAGIGDNPKPFNGSKKSWENVVVCDVCGKPNYASNRGYCMYCGAGIGDNPRPFTFDDEALSAFEKMMKRRRDRFRFLDGLKWQYGCLLSGGLTASIAGLLFFCARWIHYIGIIDPDLGWDLKEIFGWFVLIVFSGLLIWFFKTEDE